MREHPRGRTEEYTVEYGRDIAKGALEPGLIGRGRLAEACIIVIDTENTDQKP